MDALDHRSSHATGSARPAPPRAGASPITADLLMCPPRYYGIDYEINPWMNRQRQVVRRRAMAQWRNLYRALTGETATLSGPVAEVELLSPKWGLPDLVFTANAGLVYGNRFVPSRFRHQERAGEEPIFRAWFAEHGFELVDLPEGCAFEGAGDALFCGETLFAGYYYRSDIRSHRMLSERLGVPVLSLELVDPRFYHLDTCFCPLDSAAAIYYPGAFDEYGRRVLQERIPHLIGINDEDAARFGANAVVLGRDVFLNAGCDTLYRQLEEHGLQPHAVELGEFLKSGGSAKCLTLDLQAPR
jgi:N-dimethylarginine dimethylaminohydrolase